MGHTNLPLERQVGSRPDDYGCRNCDGSTYSYVTGLYYSTVTERDQVEESIITAKQAKIDLAANVARLQKLSNEMILKTQLEIQKIEDQKLQEIKNQEITFNEQQNSGDFNETPITEINPMDSCSGCGVDIHNLQYDDWVIPDDFYDTPNKDKENYLKIGGIAAVGVVAYLVFKK